MEPICPNCKAELKGYKAEMNFKPIGDRIPEIESMLEEYRKRGTQEIWYCVKCGTALQIMSWGGEPSTGKELGR